jgi:hypothetical protein
MEIVNAVPLVAIIISISPRGWQNEIEEKAPDIGPQD